MILLKDRDDPRRRQVLRALASGLFALTLAPARNYAGVLGNVPGKLPPGRSIYDLSGDVRVNGAAATIDTVIRPSDTVETGADGKIIFVVGKDAFMMRANSKMVMKGESSTIASMLLLGGRVLSVFGSGKKQLRTPTAIAGIRGTGVYTEADPQETYFCTCYGVVDLQSAADPGSRETVASKQHDRPLYIATGQSAGKAIRAAPMKNHTDAELALIEALVGRQPPFVFGTEDYAAPRREY